MEQIPIIIIFKINKYRYVTNGILKNYKLVFNHSGMLGNIKKVIMIMKGTIAEADEDNLKILNKKEFMYDIIKLNVIGSIVIIIVYYINHRYLIWLVH